MSADKVVLLTQYSYKKIIFAKFSPFLTWLNDLYNQNLAIFFTSAYLILCIEYWYSTTKVILLLNDASFLSPPPSHVQPPLPNNWLSGWLPEILAFLT